MPWGRGDDGQDAAFTESVIAARFRKFTQTTKMMSPALANLERLLLDDRRPHDSLPSSNVRLAHPDQDGRRRQPRSS
jgi:hypothetical protein